MKINKTIHYTLFTIHWRRSRPGQALVVLLVFISIATVIIGGAVALTIINSQSTSKFALGEEALAVAEAGADNAILKLLRFPIYDGSNLPQEILTVGSGTATIDVSGSPTVTISSTGQVGDIVRKIEVVGTYQNNRFAIISFKQVN